MGVLRPREVAGYAAGSVGTGAFGTLPGLVLAYYLTDTLAVPAGLAAIVVLVPKIWDVLIDPAVGALSDREAAIRATRTRLMTLGALTLPAGFIATFTTPAGLAGWAAGAWVIVAFLLATTSFSLFQVPYIALPADLTSATPSSYAERTRLMGWRIATLAFTILLVGAGGPALRDAAGGGRAGYLTMAVGMALLMAGGMLGCVAGVRGRQPAAPSRQTATAAEGYAAGVRLLRTQRPYRTLVTVFTLQAIATGVMLAAAQYVATYVLGSASALTVLFVALVAPAVLVMPWWGRVAWRVGKPRALAYASGLFLAGCVLLLGVATLPSWSCYLAVAIAGLGYAGMQLFPLAMLPDVITAAGRDQGGAMSGLWTAAETAGLALGPFIVLLLLAAGGFVSSGAEAVTQPASAITVIAAAFSVVPGVLVLLSLLVLRRYHDPGVADD